EAAPKPKVSARKKKGDSASSTTPPTPTPTTTAESALRLSALAKGKQPLRATTPVEPTDLLRTEAEQLKITAKGDEENKETGKGGDEVRKSGGESKEEEETSEEEEGSFDPIPRTPEDSEKESDDEEEQESRFSEEARIQEEEDAEELYPFRFEERLRLLETSFYEYRQTNQFANALSAIPDIVHQYMDQQMKEAVREAVQIQTDQLQDSLQRENDEFLRNIDENMKTALVEAYEADKAILDTFGESTILKRRREDDDQEGPSTGPNRGSKRQKEGGEQALASTPSEKATKGAGGSTKGTQSRQQSANDQPIVQTSQHPEWFSQPRKPPSPDRAWNTALPAAQGDAQSLISDLAKQADARSSFNELLDTPIDFSNF
nr:hypothetical protein [Tanacetum cinerariifolium]